MNVEENFENDDVELEIESFSNEDKEKLFNLIQTHDIEMEELSDDQYAATIKLKNISSIPKNLLMLQEKLSTAQNQQTFYPSIQKNPQELAKSFLLNSGLRAAFEAEKNRQSQKFKSKNECENKDADILALFQLWTEKRHKFFSKINQVESKFYTDDNYYADNFKEYLKRIHEKEKQRTMNTDNGLGSRFKTPLRYYQANKKANYDNDIGKSSSNIKKSDGFKQLYEKEKKRLEEIAAKLKQYEEEKMEKEKKNQEKQEKISHKMKQANEKYIEMNKKRKSLIEIHDHQNESNKLQNLGYSNDEHDKFLLELLQKQSNQNGTADQSPKSNNSSKKKKSLSNRSSTKNLSINKMGKNNSSFSGSRSSSRSSRSNRSSRKNSSSRNNSTNKSSKKKEKIQQGTTQEINKSKSREERLEEFLKAKRLARKTVVFLRTMNAIRPKNEKQESNKMSSNLQDDRKANSKSANKTFNQAPKEKNKSKRKKSNSNVNNPKPILKNKSESKHQKLKSSSRSASNNSTKNNKRNSKSKEKLESRKSSRDELSTHHFKKAINKNRKVSFSSAESGSRSNSKIRKHKKSPIGATKKPTHNDQSYNRKGRKNEKPRKSLKINRSLSSSRSNRSKHSNNSSVSNISSLSSKSNHSNSKYADTPLGALKKRALQKKRRKNKNNKDSKENIEDVVDQKKYLENKNNLHNQLTFGNGQGKDLIAIKNQKEYFPEILNKYSLFKKVLSSASISFDLPQKISQSISLFWFSLKQQLHYLCLLEVYYELIEEIYSAKWEADTESMKNNLKSSNEAPEVRPQNFVEFVYQYIALKFKSNPEQMLVNILFSVDSHRTSYLPAKIFCMFAADDFDEQEIQFFLFLRSLFEKEMKFLIFDKKKKSVKNPSLYSLSRLQIKDLLTAAFGETQRKLASEILNKIINVYKNENINYNEFMFFVLEIYKNSKIIKKKTSAASQPKLQDQKAKKDEGTNNFKQIDKKGESNLVNAHEDTKVLYEKLFKTLKEVAIFTVDQIIQQHEGKIAKNDNLYNHIVDLVQTKLKLILKITIKDNKSKWMQSLRISEMSNTQAQQYDNIVTHISKLKKIPASLITEENSLEFCQILLQTPELVKKIGRLISKSLKQNDGQKNQLMQYKSCTSSAVNINYQNFTSIKLSIQ